MSGTCEIKRNADGLKIKIKSERIESLFKSLAKENRTTLAVGNTTFDGWFHPDYTDKFIRNISDMFVTQAQTAGRGIRNGENNDDLIIPSFRSSALFVNNTVGINFLMARGLTEGKEFQIAGMYSIETTTKIGKALHKAMDYLINESAKACTITFEIHERTESNSEPTILEFPTRR